MGRCENCTRNSVISYTYFRKVCLENKLSKRGGQHLLLGPHHHYSRMCIHLELALRCRTMNEQE